MKQFANSIIPDAELAEYLMDKLLIKPDYNASVGPTEVSSDYAAVKARMDAMRAKDNDKVKKDYRLKGKK